jgi:CheY-like chemotaxis protein
VKVMFVAANPRVVGQVDTALLGVPDVEVERVPSVKRTLELLDEGATPDLVLADADMAPSGGMHLAREIKARGQMGRAMPPVVLLIAREQDAWLSNWSQADAYVRKPADPFDLAEVIERVGRGERPPALPGVGGEPTPSLLDIPSAEQKMVDAEHDTGKGSDRGR